ncbi:MAG: MerR family transcriptional regulator [Planctomycetaceae bacterium]|nr:MerR family transcriptional regulator [Planctomycetaceae bacterium]
MERRFQISELRTLIARALQFIDYTPAESARVRAVPDTRTIRYYTTLGLISPPSELRGRTAFYEEMHVLQVVAIKRLQAQNLTLSDIQNQLAGLPASKLNTIAGLPADFWEAADRYLAEVTERAANADDFWLVPAAMPESSGGHSGRSPDFELQSASQSKDRKAARVTDSNSVVQVGSLIRVPLANGVVISVELPLTAGSLSFDGEALQLAIQPLVKELQRQKLMET